MVLWLQKSGGCMIRDVIRTNQPHSNVEVVTV